MLVSFLKALADFLLYFFIDHNGACLRSCFVSRPVRELRHERLYNALAVGLLAALLVGGAVFLG